MGTIRSERECFGEQSPSRPCRVGLHAHRLGGTAAPGLCGMGGKNCLREEAGRERALGGGRHRDEVVQKEKKKTAANSGKKKPLLALCTSVRGSICNRYTSMRESICSRCTCVRGSVYLQ